METYRNRKNHFLICFCRLKPPKGHFEINWPSVTSAIANPFTRTLFNFVKKREKKVSWAIIFITDSQNQNKLKKFDNIWTKLQKYVVNKNGKPLRKKAIIIYLFLHGDFCSICTSTFICQPWQISDRCAVHWNIS